jgi:hypothetical protein
MIDRKYWPLIAAYSSKTGTLAPVQLQKTLFLIGRNLDVAKLTSPSFYEFRPYDYGPFSAVVYCDADELEAEGLLEIQRPPDSQYKLYLVTSLGAAKAKRLRPKLEPQALDYIDRIVPWTCSLSFNQLVSIIYEHYPEMKKNSVFSK